MPTNKSKARILIIEDDASIPMLLHAWFAKYSNLFTLEHVSDPDVALGVLDGVALILLDLVIPPNYPMERTRDLIPKLSQVAPVILLTNYSDGDEPAQSKFVSDCICEYGADFVFFKGMLTKENVEWLVLIIQAAIGRRLYASKRPPEPKPISRDFP